MTKQEVLDYLDNVLHPIVSPDNWNVYSELCDMIEELPSAEPVRHGKWIWKGEEGDSRWMCSACLWREYVPTCNGVPDIWNYCPSCGARMDEE